MINLLQESLQENIPDIKSLKHGVIKHAHGDKLIWGIIIIFYLISILVVYSSTGSLVYLKYQGNTN
ncbi:MAG: hypothetical protein ORN85_10455, partial [Sediminibacterium sp.]|nr:hypothetical protein [Sediminibacterium sp.]